VNIERAGKFITLEGVDGAGKSTHLEWLAGWLRRSGKEILVTREPGGTPLGEKLRALLLAEPMHVETETLIMFAARREHLARVVVPALAAGKWVISDRFTDASFAYQGGGRGLPERKIAILEQWVQEGLQPDLTLVFDVPVEVARARLARLSGLPDKFEREDEAFFRRVRAAYLDRAAAAPERMKIIDASEPLDNITKVLEKVISTFCNK